MYTIRDESRNLRTKKVLTGVSLIESVFLVESPGEKESDSVRSGVVGQTSLDSVSGQFTTPGVTHNLPGIFRS